MTQDQQFVIWLWFVMLIAMVQTARHLRQSLDSGNRHMAWILGASLLMLGFVSLQLAAASHAVFSSSYIEIVVSYE